MEAKPPPESLKQELSGMRGTLYVNINRGNNECSYLLYSHAFIIN